MFGSQVLDVGIGLAMLFAFMSLIATALNEALETVLKARAKQLEQGIRNILNDPDGDKIAKTFFDNPLISILYPGDYNPGNLNGASAPAGANLSSVSARSRSMRWRFRQDLPSYIPAANFALAVLNVAAKGAPTSATQIRDAIDTTLAGSPQLKDVVLQALASGQDDLAAAQKFLENWFDAAMDRVSGWYKRRSQFFLFCIGLFAAVALNVDTITVARSLMSDTALRQTVVNHAADHVNQTDLNFKESEDALIQIGYPIGWADLPQLRSSLTKATCDPSDCISKLLTSGAPTIAPMILGWLITALAITLGAPFWFDLLSKFMQVRAAGKGQPPDGGGSQANAPASSASQSDDDDTPTQASPKAADASAGLGAADQLALAPLIAAGQAGFVGEQWADGSDRGTL